MDESLFPIEHTPAPAAPKFYVRVAVERGFAGSDGSPSLTYGCDDETVDVGTHVRVPLGRGDTPTRGIVVATGDESLLEGFDPARVKRVIDRGRSALPPDLVELARWISSYYVAPLGLTLQTMTPAAVKKDVGGRREVVLGPPRPHPSDEPDALKSLAPSARKAWAGLSSLDPSPFPATARELADAIGAPTVAPINRLRNAGWLAESSRDTVRTRADATEGLLGGPSVSPQLNEAQRGAVERVGDSMDRFGVHLLLGVTGSGKTEVYMHLIQRVIDAGRTAILLVPEISLTPQTAGRFVSRFGADRVAVLHSGLTASQRNQQWSDARSGARKIVIGARSAVFAPLTDLGLVVVDEEHDGSYKQEQVPRYHARDVAIMRARTAGCPVVLGSATPSLESWANAARGKAQLIRLPRRATGAPMPEVRLVDLAEERRRLVDSGASPYRLVGPRLEAALRSTLDAGKQAILLLNRRGFASFVSCTNHSCGWSLGCERCSVRMVMHKHRDLPLGGFVKCHHCHAEQRVPRRCPVCASNVVKIGSGTQRAEDELRALFPDGALDSDALVRVDADSMRSATHYFEVLDRFARGHARVMLGTQMIAKGLDFPNVALVGVLNADTALSLPDFRAGERTFQLIAQVAGRTGRAGHGDVIVQTMEPDAAPLVHASTHDFEGFARSELDDRAQADLPPVSRMVRIVVRDRDPDRGRTLAERICRSLQENAEPGVRADGPLPCVIERIDERYRFAIELFGASAAALHSTVDRSIKHGVLVPGPDVMVDVDPLSLL